MLDPEEELFFFMILFLFFKLFSVLIFTKYRFLSSFSVFSKPNSSFFNGKTIKELNDKDFSLGNENKLSLSSKAYLFIN